MNIHGSFSESSVSYRVVTHDRKGREGKGREVGHPSIVPTGSASRRMDGSLRDQIGGL